tara:strand:- start:70024 stop:70689 length:666 start_codon:yes stop_codon:yes gene_type:complete
MKRLVGRIQIWWPVAIVLIAAVCVIVSGIWGRSFTGGCASDICNAVRSLEWEAMSAGLFGLAGGLAVIVAMRRQIEHSEKIAQKQRQDFLLVDINAQLADIEAICAACFVYITHTTLLSSAEVSDEIADAIVMKMYTEDDDYPIKDYLRRAEDLRQKNLVPMQIKEAFDQVIYKLRDLQTVVDLVSFEEIPANIKSLENAIETLRVDLISYRKRMLEFRIV